MPNFVQLGRSGLRVSPLCLGTMNFGNEQWGCDEPTSVKIIDAYLGAGHNFIDTANVYAGGRSEEIVGRAIASRRDRSSSRRRASTRWARARTTAGNSRANLTRSLENSLRRLGTDYVDLYQCHAWDATTPIEETMATLDDFVRYGKVRYIGCSNWLASEIVEAQWAAQPRRRNAARLAAAAVLADRPGHRDRHPADGQASRPRRHRVVAARRRTAHRQAHEGQLAGRLALRQGRRRRHLGDDRRSLFTDRNFEIVDKVGEVAKATSGRRTRRSPSRGRSRSDGVTSAIIGPRTAEQLEDNLAADEPSSSRRMQLKDLDRASRGPHDLRGLPAARPLAARGRTSGGRTRIRSGSGSTP